MPIGFAPTNPVQYPPIGTPPINPGNNQPKMPDALTEAIKEKAPLIAAILSTPVGCDLPEQGGISGNINRTMPPYQHVCYMA